MRILIGYKPMVYCAGKLIENFKLFYKSNRRHFLKDMRGKKEQDCYAG